MTAALSGVCHDATSKLKMIGAMLDSRTARATGCVLAARIAYDTIRRNTLLPMRSHTTMPLLISSPAYRTPRTVPRWSATIRNSLPNSAIGIS
jgi:hypothetical protein